MQLHRNQPVMMSRVDFLDLYTRRYVSFERTTPVSMSQVEILRPRHVTPCVVTTRVDTQVKFFRPEHVEDVMVTSMNDVVRNDVLTTFTHYRSNIHQHIMTNTLFALANVHQTHAATICFREMVFQKKKHTHCKYPNTSNITLQYIASTITITCFRTDICLTVHQTSKNIDNYSTTHQSYNAQHGIPRYSLATHQTPQNSPIKKQSTSNVQCNSRLFSL